MSPGITTRPSPPATGPRIRAPFRCGYDETAIASRASATCRSAAPRHVGTCSLGTSRGS